MDRYIQEARRFQVRILPPDINKSNTGFSVEGRAIRIGFLRVKGLGITQIKHILKTRDQDGPFLSLHDFCARIDSARISRTVIENLIKIGAFDFMTYPRSVLLNILPIVLKEIRKEKKQCQLS
jgi:DNA polymerase-3 subunit alpha